MIDGLIAGKVYGQPLQRIAKTGKPFSLKGRTSMNTPVSKTTAQRQASYRTRQKLAGKHRLTVQITGDTKLKLDKLTAHWRATQRGALQLLVTEAVKRLNLVTA